MSLTQKSLALLTRFQVLKTPEIRLKCLCDQGKATSL